MNNLIQSVHGHQFGTGWVDDPAARSQILDEWRAVGRPVGLADAAPHLMAEAVDDAPVFFWEAERMVLNRLLKAWNQRQVGSCVGFGATRTGQDCMLWEIASGAPEEWPGAEGCPEVTYGGSRVEVGGGQFRGQDGSVGAWAAKFLENWGYVIRGKYGSLDLTTYDEQVCRRLGDNGLPTDLETVAKQHPVKSSAQVNTKEEGWAAMGGGKPVFNCSIVGYTMQLDSEGYCRRSGQWGHCTATRARFVQPDRGRSVVIGNSWGDYLTPNPVPVKYVAKDGTVKTFDLPPGHFCVTWNDWGVMLAEEDSFALAGLSGWAKKSIDYTP